MAPPFYIAMECNPDNGCEIQDICNGCARVMLKLKVVKQSVAGDAHEDDNHLPHGGKVLNEFIMPWAYNWVTQIICADSYFSLVATAEELDKMHL